MSKFPLACCFMLAFVVAGCGADAAGSHIAAKVNGHAISMAAYHKQLGYKLALAEQNGPNPCKATGYQGVCKEVKLDALNDLVAAEVVRQYAKQHHITVSKAAFQHEWTVVYKQKFHSNALVLKAYARGLRFKPEDVKNLYRENLLDNAVMARVTASMPVTVTQVRLARVSATSQKAIQQWARGARASQSLLAFERTRPKACRQADCTVLPWSSVTGNGTHARQLEKAKTGQVLGPYHVAKTTWYLYQVVDKKPPARFSPQAENQQRQKLFGQWIAAQERTDAIHRYIT
ncbi:MAG: SurA N-terminal domain-containing protein [Chloroflexota bacterium]